MKENACTEDQFFRQECRERASGAPFETQPGYASGGVVTDWGAGVDSAGAAVGGSMNPSQYDGIPRGR